MLSSRFVIACTSTSPHEVSGAYLQSLRVRIIVILNKMRAIERNSVYVNRVSFGAELISALQCVADRVFGPIRGLGRRAMVLIDTLMLCESRDPIIGVYDRDSEM